MSEIIEIKATARPRAGKGAARQARREGNVPAVIYGDGQPAEIIAINGNDLWKQFIKGHFTSSVFDIAVGSNKIRVIPRDVQVDPVKDHPIHVDFLRIGKDGVIRVSVPVRFTNHTLSPGLKRGGVLNIVRHDVEVFCPYDRIPPFFEINLEGLEIGRSIHISSVAMPDGVTPVIARDFTVATIAGAKKDEEEATAAGAAEGGAGAPAGDAKAAAPAAGAKAGAAPAKGAAPAAAAGKAAPAAKPAAKK
ncbi:50S ribosomal protein L25/general stress protein Ctc [uncultured Hyphomicrobium sp.]|uniref:50S ribosomal protein L25/general stress protein Ctc n=1 Tax=uncultured Hyphomicrobium sp. TaxID=194373 RepID=UPI0025F68019|nr:50S ribosomal protein L25/general stress protein Ctc [uncultured Hyphomicrobium sp.]